MSNENCCEKCQMTSNHPIEMQSEDCTDTSCKCHTPSTDTMEERFDDFLSEAELTEVNTYAEDRIKDFIRQEIYLALKKRNEEYKLALKLLSIARCPDTSCDQNGTIANQISEDEWEAQQCQWCDERKKVPELLKQP